MLLQAIYSHADQRPDTPALQGAGSVLSYAELARQLRRTSGALRDRDVRTLGLLADNGVGWVLADLAAFDAGVLLVPLPPFFAASQLQHAIRDSGMDAILTDQPERIEALLDGQCSRSASAEFGGLQLLRLAAPAVASVPAHSAKITYTSGTTGQPKGVCLSREAMEGVAQSLCDAAAGGADDRHLCLLPLSTLLENLAGIYAPLLAGACSCVLPLNEVGLRGAAALDPGAMLQAMQQQRASSVIMVPQMLLGLVAALGQGAAVPAQLRFIAVGGAPVSPQLLARARQLGLPVYEGYGLSECASVLTLNTPEVNRPGSVGKPLSHVRIRFAADGEVIAGGAVFLGYLGQADGPDAQGWWPTGDIGHFDADGYLHLTGRKKNMFITSFGRNVAPEWVESELTLHPAIAQAAVFGEAQPWSAALIVPRQLPGIDAENAIIAAVVAANQSLPDYARVRKWLVAHEPFTPQNGMLTANGRLRRDQILTRYGEALDDLYRKESHGVL